MDLFKSPFRIIWAGMKPSDKNELLEALASQWQFLSANDMNYIFSLSQKSNLTPEQARILVDCLNILSEKCPSFKSQIRTAFTTLSQYRRPSTSLKAQKYLEKLSRDSLYPLG